MHVIFIFFPFLTKCVFAYTCAEWWARKGSWAGRVKTKRKGMGIRLALRWRIGFCGQALCF